MLSPATGATLLCVGMVSLVALHRTCERTFGVGVRLGSLGGHTRMPKAAKVLCSLRGRSVRVALVARGRAVRILPLSSG